MTNLKKEIKRVGLTQREIAKEMGVTLRTVQNWCAGKTTPSKGQKKYLTFFLKTLDNTK